MEKYQNKHLLFLHDFGVSFVDNMSELDLRKVKKCERMDGGFRKDSVYKMYCNILTMLEIFKRRNMLLLENIKQVFTGTLAMKYLVLKVACLTSRLNSNLINITSITTPCPHIIPVIRYRKPYKE